MGSVVHVHRVQYAVVEANYSKARSERFVLAYEKERSLREFIAEPRIIASGFSSEQEAANACNAHGRPLRRWLLPFEARLNTLSGHLGFVRSFWRDLAQGLHSSPPVPLHVAQEALLRKPRQNRHQDPRLDRAEVCC
jgi:hypothetical protein